MYSYEERIRAIKFYINCGYNAAYTVRKLGYPDESQIRCQYFLKCLPACYGLVFQPVLY